MKYIDGIDRWKQNAARVSKERSIGIIIDGVEYESINDASLKTGMSQMTISRNIKAINKSGFNSLDVETTIKKMFTFSKTK